jgi:DNA-binding CsgD family transcriptional regulator
VPDLPVGLFGASTGAAAALVAVADPSSDEPSNDPAAALEGEEARFTRAEERAARLAASGLTNREIAQALSIAARDVGFLLSRVYTKLGARSGSRRGSTPPPEPIEVGAIVSRGGRPDLAGDALGYVSTPTLLIVGERDPQVLELNREAQARIRCESRLEIVPGATHLFEEPGALARVADLAAGWFAMHLRGPGSGP